MLIDKDTLHKVLIINLGGIGDILLSTPALRALKSNFPDTEFTLMVVPRVYSIISELSYVDKIAIFYKQKRLFLKNVFTLLDLRRKEFDVAINMRTLVSKNSAKTIRLLLDIIRPKFKVGRDTEGRGYFFDIKIPETDGGEKYEMQYDIDTVKALGVEVVDRDIDFKPDEKNMENIDKILEKEGIHTNDVIVGIHPGGQPIRQWPIDNFFRVMKGIEEKINCKFVVTGASGETKIINRLIKMTDIKLINMAGRLNIKEWGALIQRLHLYITNDTGPMHMAAALKIPLVAIFGPGHVGRYDPRNISDKAIVLYKKVDCAPCENVECESMRCLRAISAEEVVKAALRFLK